MFRDLARILSATAAAGLGFASIAPAHAARSGAAATTRVPCSAAALASAVRQATKGETLSLTAFCVYRLNSGLPMISKILTINGNSATLQRWPVNGNEFTILRANNGNLTVNNLNFRNGHNAIAVTGSTELTVNGGQFVSNSGTHGGAISDTSGLDGPVVTGALFTSNTATGDGGAIYDNTPGGGVVLTDCTFMNNRAGRAGGGIFDFSALDDSATGARFIGNRAATGGAGLFSTDATSLSHVVARGNVASGGGGGFVVDNTFTIDSSDIENNQAIAGSGGGLYADNEEGSLLENVAGSTISGNSAVNGGGIYTENAVILTLTSDQITGNSASRNGGGLFAAVPFSFPEIKLKDAQITTNTAGNTGGGIYNQADADFTLTASSVQANQPNNCRPVGSVSGCNG